MGAEVRHDKAGPRSKTASRQTQLRKLLSRKSGASIGQIQKAFGWQPHTVRAAISGLRKAGFEISRSDTEHGSVYRIIARAGDQ